MRTLTAVCAHDRVLVSMRPLCRVCQKNLAKKKYVTNGQPVYTGICSTCRRTRKTLGPRYDSPHFPIAMLPEGPLKDERIRLQSLLGRTDRKGLRHNARYRKFLKDHCERCGFQPVDYIQLDAHHRDGNHKHDTAENIETLCANCHRLEHITVPRPV